MIERNYGKIVSTCSVSAIDALPFGITYTATKYGVDGFMNALYDELCLLELDEKIKLTTIFPDFIRTRKELEHIINDKMKLIYDLMTPERVADEAVEAIKLGKREKIISDLTLVHLLAQ
jgi:short-subunit dehydrogenase